MEKGKGHYSVRIKINKRLKNIIWMLFFFLFPVKQLCLKLLSPAKGGRAPGVSKEQPCTSHRQAPSSAYIGTVQGVNCGRWHLGITFAKSRAISPLQISPMWAVKSQTPPQPHPAPRKSSWPFRFPHRSHTCQGGWIKAEQGLTKTVCAFSYINISKPWSGAFNIWRKHCAVKVGRNSLLFH